MYICGRSNPLGFPSYCNLTKIFKKLLIPNPLTKEKLDRVFLALVLILLSIGLVILFSASYPYGLQYRNDSAYYIKRQAIFAVAGLFVMLVISFINYKFYCHYAFILYAVTMFMLFCVKFIPLPMFRALSGAHRWIILGNLISFQPSEIAKFVIICVLGRMALAIGKDEINTFKNGFLLLCIPTGLMALLILIEPHISGTVIFCVISFACMIAAGIDKKTIYIICGFGLIMILLVISFPNILTFIAKYGGSRVRVWLDPFNYARTTGYQTVQSLYAISSGGLWGVGIGQSHAKHLYLPEPFNDYIFAIACEELGLIGAAIIIVLFIFLVCRGLYIARKSKDKFGKILATGISVQVGAQVFFNIAVVTNLIPSTGISLPFFSYGGTSLLMLLCEMGVMLNISRGIMEEGSLDI